MESMIIRKNYTVTQIWFQFSFIAVEAANNDKVFMSTMIVFFEYSMHLKVGRGINTNLNKCSCCSSDISLI